MKLMKLKSDILLINFNVTSTFLLCCDEDHAMYRYIHVHSILFHAWKHHRLRYNKFERYTPKKLRNCLHPDPLWVIDILGIGTRLSSRRCPCDRQKGEGGGGQARPICRLIGPGHGGLNIRPRSSTRCVYASSATN